MKLIKPYYKIITQQPGEIGMLKHIETCGRVAWKSEERTTDDSYLKFIEMLKGVNHGSVLEHGTVYLKYPSNYMQKNINYNRNKYSKCNFKIEPISGVECNFCTTNYRVLVENNWLDDLKYQCEPTKYHEKRVTIRLVIDRGVSHEFVRHRTFSFTQESTRYCNYSKDKYGSELTYIIPCWLNEEFESGNYLDINTFGTNGSNWYNQLLCSEEGYIDLIEHGWKAQQARAILPNSLKTELIMTGFVSDWKHFFMLRCAPGAHPQAQEIAIPLEQEFKRLELI